MVQVRQDQHQRFAAHMGAGQHGLEQREKPPPRQHAGQVVEMGFVGKRAVGALQALVEVAGDAMVLALPQQGPHHQHEGQQHADKQHETQRAVALMRRQLLRPRHQRLGYHHGQVRAGIARHRQRRDLATDTPHQGIAHPGGHPRRQRTLRGRGSLVEPRFEIHALVLGEALGRRLALQARVGQRLAHE
ncbi:hypothetical protein RALBFv3_04645 [Ralstonia solanacearum]|nr:hypothetical protein RALBFv3_04645 [Ralstonia solanacearum]